MTLDHKSGSREIAQHTREQSARDAMGHYADLRNGGLLPEKRPPHGAGIIWAITVMIVLSVGFVAGYFLGDVPQFEPGPGYDICQTKRC